MGADEKKSYIPKLQDIEFENIYIQIVDMLEIGKIEEAKKIIKDLNLSGIDTTKIIEEIFIPALRLVGDRWYRNELNIAQEHYITEVIEKLFDYISESNEVDYRDKFTALFMAPPGEEHLIGLRMSTEYFRIRGWDLRFIGRSIPVESLIQIIKKDNIDLIVLSSMTEISLNSSSYMTEAIRSNLKEKSPLILLGGSSVNPLNQDLINSFADYSCDDLAELNSKILQIETDIVKKKKLNKIS